VRIGPGEPHQMQLVRLDSTLEILGLPLLLIRPEAVFFDESEGLCHLCHSMRDREGAKTVSDGAHAIQLAAHMGAYPDFRDPSVRSALPSRCSHHLHNFLVG
jgi:hypothetical protein